MIYAAYITYISSKKEAPLGLPLQGVRFVDSNNWIVNGMPNLRTVR